MLNSLALVLNPGGGGGAPCNGLHGQAPYERVTVDALVSDLGNSKKWS